MDDKEKKIRALESRLEILEMENQLLSERSEDMMLMSLLSDIAGDIDDYVELLRQMLERIAILKDLLLCTCGIIKENTLIPFASYCLCSDDDIRPEIGMSIKLLEDLKEGAIVLKDDQLRHIACGPHHIKEDMGINEVLIIPFLFQMKIPAAFLFGGNRADDPRELATLLPLLQQLTQLIEDRINTIFLLDKLKQINKDLENRVVERTRDLEFSKKKLEDEIQTRKQFEQKLIEARNKAVESEKLKSAFLANMSHEIRTPMNAIMGFSDLLQRDNLSQEERKTFLGILKTKGNELLTLINDILDLSRIEANQINIVFEKLNLFEFIELSYRNWKKMLIDSGKNDLNIILDNRINEKCIAALDQVRLSQILNNLVSNAIKFTYRGHITISCEQNDDELEFKVKDTGIGIPDNKISIIFDRFRQVDDSKTRKFGGTGLGLSICKQLVELMGGTIGVHSKEEIGSEFWFSLPYIQKRAEESEEKNSTFIDKELINGSEQKRLLIVEDDESNFQLLKSVLRSAKFDIKLAKDGEEAIKIFEESAPFDLVLMDLHLPKMNGFDVSRRMRQIRKDTRILGQTAISHDEIRQLDNEKLLDDYILKPINIDMLYDKINELLSDKK